VKANVLIIEDEEALAGLTKAYLNREGIDNRIAASAEEAVIAAAEEKFDLVILDINLPGMDGFEFLQEFRKWNPAPVMIVSARETDEDVIAGLSSGADEFVSKPVAPRVLVARVRALLRRTRMKGTDDPLHKVTAFAGYELDHDACLLVRGAERITLSAREFDVLAFLVDNAGKSFLPSELYSRIWGQRYGDPTTIGVYIQRLRKKIEQDQENPKILQTVKGKGYRFDSSMLEGKSPP
jgi:DNA-binding response OmpR family regulator